MKPAEEYFVAKIEERVKKIDWDEIYSAVEFKKGEWIVKIRWYVFCPSVTNWHGDRSIREVIYVNWLCFHSKGSQIKKM